MAIQFNDTIDPNVGMWECAERGFLNGVEFYIKRGANDFFRGLLRAALGGHKDIVDFFIVKTKDDADIWDWGLYCAATGGHQQLVDMFIKRGGSLCWGIAGAINGKHGDMEKSLSERYLGKN